ncbi:MAG: LacI family DNA-binding transcriptional regulator [Leeuwenhoekiella sp.]
MSKLGLKDIAKVFGVSVSTVSKALHDSAEISVALREKIQAYAKENNYRRNLLAVNLISKQTKTIAVVVPDVLNYFFTQVFAGVQKVANARGYKIISCITADSLEQEIELSDYLASGTVDGVILSLAQETQFSENFKHLSMLSAADIPLVMFDRVTDAVDCDKLVVDDLEGARRATQHFINTGSRTIAVVTPIDRSSVGKLRLEGYKKALAENEIAYDEKLVLRLSPKDNLDLLMSFLLNYKSIESILVFDEVTAVEVLRIVKSRGYSVPEHISIIGFTSGMVSRYVTPSLTVVSQHGSYLGENAATMLIDRIEGKGATAGYVTKTVKTSLIVRDSTRKV